MAEYIEREALENAFEDENKNGNFVFTANWIMEILDNLPPADVVPKSEVDKDIKALTKEVAKQKAMLLDAIDTFRNLLCIESFVDYEDTRKHYVVNLDDVDRIHDELKKKYTEDV